MLFCIDWILFKYLLKLMILLRIKDCLRKRNLFSLHVSIIGNWTVGSVIGRGNLDLNPISSIWSTTLWMFFKSFLNNGICYFMEISTFCFYENCTTFEASYLTYMDHIYIYFWYILEPLYLIFVINMISRDCHILKLHEPTSLIQWVWMLLLLLTRII